MHEYFPGDYAPPGGNLTEVPPGPSYGDMAPPVGYNEVPPNPTRFEQQPPTSLRCGDMIPPGGYPLTGNEQIPPYGFELQPPGVGSVVPPGGDMEGGYFAPPGGDFPFRYGSATPPGGETSEAPPHPLLFEYVPPGMKHNMQPLASSCETQPLISGEVVPPGMKRVA